MPTITTAEPAITRLRTQRELLYAQGFVPGDSGKQIPTFPSGITQPRGEQLRDLFLPERPARTIETGFALGLSSLYILEATLECHAPEQVHHTAVDPFQRTHWDNAGLRTIREAGLTDHFRLLQEDSALVLPALVSAGEVFDAAFVDGSHLFDGVLIDISYMARLVRPGGIIVLDDYWMPAIRAAIDFFVTNLSIPMRLINDDKGRPRLAVLTVPRTVASRKWDHFVPFVVT